MWQKIEILSIRRLIVLTRRAHNEYGRYLISEVGNWTSRNSVDSISGADCMSLSYYYIIPTHYNGRMRKIVTVL